MLRGDDESANAVRYLIWILTLPIVLLAVVFSVANRGPVEIDLWPLDLRVALPLYLLLLLSLFVGLLLGLVVAHFSAGRSRTQARDSRYRAEMLERENARLKKQAADAPASGGAQRVPSLPAS